MSKEFNIKEYYKKINEQMGTDKLTFDLKLKNERKCQKSDHLGGVRYEFKFANGYGASVIKNFGSYGAKSDRWELAILKGNDFASVPQIFGGDLVRGWLSDDEIEQYLEQIENLEPVKRGGFCNVK